MKVFIDTNIILEYFMHREKYEVAEKLLKELHNRGAQMFKLSGTCPLSWCPLSWATGLG